MVYIQFVKNVKQKIQLVGDNKTKINTIKAQGNGAKNNQLKNGTLEVCNAITK